MSKWVSRLVVVPDADENVEQTPLYVSMFNEDGSPVDFSPGTPSDGGSSTVELPRRAASYGSRRGRTISAQFSNQGLTAAQWDLTNFEYTTGSDGRPGLKATDWLALATLVAKPQFTWENSETHVRLEIPSGGVHSSNTVRVCNRYTNPNNNTCGAKIFHASNPVVTVNEAMDSAPSPIRSVAQANIADGAWHLVYGNYGPVHFFKAWPETGDESDWQIVTRKGDLAFGYPEIGVPAFTLQYAENLVITSIVSTELLYPEEDLAWNGDFSINDNASGLPIGWQLAADGVAGTTTFEDVEVGGILRRFAVLERTAPEGGGAGLTLGLHPRASFRVPRFPSTIPRWARYLELGITHRMENLQHEGVASFLGAAASVYYDDIKSGGLNTTGGSGGGAQTDYYTGWGPSGVVGGTGAAGGLGSTDGFIRETRCIPLHPAFRTDRVQVSFVQHDSDVTGKWTLGDITMRAIA